MSSKLWSFATPFGRYCFNRLPYGLSCSSEVFQEQMFNIFGNIKGCAIYIDGIIIFANTIEEHNAIIEKVLKTADEHNIKFNRSKCKF